MNKSFQYLWGVDLGGTKIEATVVEPNSSTTLARIRIPTEAHLGYDHILSQVEKVIQMVESEFGLSRGATIGIGTPGAIDLSTGRLRNSNTTCLIGRPMVEDLGELLGVQVKVANDANCFALAEAMFGAGQNAQSVFGVILGTGVGGGIIVNKKILNGLNGIAGEWGHNMLDPNGVKCYCGKIGCVETILSGPAISRRYFEKSGIKHDLPEISTLANTGNAEAKQTIQETCEWFGLALSNVVNILDPEVIVLGGGVSNLPELYTWGRDALIKHTFHEKPRIQLVKAQLGDSAGVLGAAMLAAGD